jgi:ABC transporter with metal-binding/Fe-S-binding domain ATP-binding protein
MTLRVAVLFSGGKDSTYAVWAVQHHGWDIATLVTVNPSGPDSMLFHHPSVEWTRLQATAMGLPHIIVDEEDEGGLLNLQNRLVQLKTQERISGIVTGAVASEYQKTRFDRMCDSVGLKSYSPLWHKSARLLISDFQSLRLRTFLTAVAANGLDEKWLGVELTDDVWARFERLAVKNGIDLGGEGGEYESFVFDAPFFTKTIAVERSRKEWDGQRGQLVIVEASLRNKLTN